MNATLENIIRLNELTKQKNSGHQTQTTRKEIEDLREKLLNEVLRRFDHLVSHGRLPIAPVSESSACGSCHMKLPPADVLRIRSSSHSLPTCAFCGCFLYTASETPPVAAAT